MDFKRLFKSGWAETDILRNNDTFISVCGITDKVELWVYVMILEYLCLYGDRMDVTMLNIIFRETQMDTDNTMMEKRDRNTMFCWQIIQEDSANSSQCFPASVISLH